MPEGHSVHRIAHQFAEHFVGRRVAASSPQGRFAAGAARLDAHLMTGAKAVGKQLFLEFDHGLWLRVHLGMFGAWDFTGDVSTDAIGAPRRARVRMAERETVQETTDDWPPEPVGQVRVRLLTDDAVADLRGPTACEVLDPSQVDAAMAKLGPDPLVGQPRASEEEFVRRVRKKPTPIGLLLMDQSVISGIGNVYRAELLFRARLDPHAPGKQVPEDVLRGLWRDWARLLAIGVDTGVMMTMDDLDDEAYRNAIASRDDRHWVYHRGGLPCRVCGTAIVVEPAAGRKLYWCPNCQT